MFVISGDALKDLSYNQWRLGEHLLYWLVSCNEAHIGDSDSPLRNPKASLGQKVPLPAMLKEPACYKSLDCGVIEFSRVALHDLSIHKAVAGWKLVRR